jgi:prevent-host-death family protein
MEVGVLEAKNRLSELIERAERGERVVITRHGRAVATLSGAQVRPSKADVERIMAEVAAARANLPPISSEDILQTIQEGREERYNRTLSR